MDTALDTAKLLMDNVFKCFGLPDRVISNRGPLFMAKTMQEVARQLHIKWTHSTAFHPQTDSQTERVNQELESYLRMYCQGQADE